MVGNISSIAKWILGILGGFALLVAGVFLAGTSLVGSMLGGHAIGTETETVNTQVTNAIDRTGEVALMSLGVQGIERRTDKATFFGMDVPGSERALFLQYEFTGKLGLDGEDVRIEQTADKKYTIRIPKFIFIGFSDPHFQVAVENNGVLSWTTPAIDTTDMTNRILSEESLQAHVTSNREPLTEQAEAFYGGIIAGVDPDIELDFQFDAQD